MNAITPEMLDWFQNPQLPGPTPVAVEQHGDSYRIAGHIATWDSCHLGYEGECVTPPRSTASYRYFNLTPLSAGSDIKVGPYTINTGHADGEADPAQAIAHYDNTGTIAAAVTAGEDEHGIWITGAVLDPDAVPVLQASRPSGDWRRINGNLELVGILAVPSPGFPVAASSLAAAISQAQQSIPAADEVDPLPVLTRYATALAVELKRRSI